MKTVIFKGSLAETKNLFELIPFNMVGIPEFQIYKGDFIQEMTVITSVLAKHVIDDILEDPGLIQRISEAFIMHYGMTESKDDEFIAKIIDFGNYFRKKGL